jgi:hypothetical protein
MFASRTVNKLIYDVLSATPGVTDVVDTRIVRGLSYPQKTTLPALLFYMEQSAYSGALGTYQYEHILGEEMRFVVRLDDKGTSDTRIAPAAEAQLKALAGKSFDLDTGEQVTFAAQGEVPLTTYVDGDTFYQRLGTIYSVTVTRGG